MLPCGPNPHATVPETGLLPSLKSHPPPPLTNLPGQRLKCQASGSNVCRVRRLSPDDGVDKISAKKQCPHRHPDTGSSWPELQGYLADKATPTPARTPWGPQHGPTVGSWAAGPTLSLPLFLFLSLALSLSLFFSVASSLTLSLSFSLSLSLSRSFSD